MLAILVCGCAATTPVEAMGGDLIRVLVLKGESSLEIRGAGPDMAVRRSFPGSAAVNGEVRELPIRLKPDGTFIHVNGRPYRGMIEIHDDEAGLMVIDELPVEAYVVGIINHEISSKWHVEAVKAQAVIARTYALYKKKSSAEAPYDLEGTVLGQVYKGVNAEDQVAARAVNSTRGEVLTYGGDPALTVYHSNAGGMTDASRDVWSGAYPYLASVRSPHDRAAPNYSWELRVKAEEIGRMLRASGVDIGSPVSIKKREVLRSGRVRSVEVRDSSGREETLTGEQLRRTLGYDALRSAVFDVKRNGTEFVFTGRGFGHGVGLSQWGAKGMAEAGYSYRKILGHYYPGTSLKRAY